jgi:hypothetical protein
LVCAAYRRGVTDQQVSGEVLEGRENGENSRPAVPLSLVRRHRPQLPIPRSAPPDRWRALIGEEDDGSLLVAVFSPECSEREFDQARPPT